MHGKPIGIMITASHNPKEDNGVKFIEPTGEMLSTDWESMATEIVNIGSDDELDPWISKHLPNTSITPTIVLGRDTRPSGAEIMDEIMAGCSRFNATVYSVGLVSTPQLHYLLSIGSTDPEMYYRHVVDSYRSFVGENTRVDGLVIDAANGIGSQVMEKIRMGISGFDLVNSGTGELNEDCGADHVKSSQSPPRGLVLEKGKRYASFDGDVDRVVYYFVDDREEFRLLDGDKIAALFVTFLVEKLDLLGIRGDISVGIVQTAYANGNSTRYMESLGIAVDCVPTGVKYLHRRAKEYDIGVYFEANGHGTILFNKNKMDWIRSLDVSGPDLEIHRQQLVGVSELANQVIGDALTDLLMVEGILRIKKTSMEAWTQMYRELPNRLLKARVDDPSMFTTTDAERRLESPVELQAEIDREVARVRSGRAFVRPSGTENVIRVYAEAETQEECDRLARNIVAAIEEKYSRRLGSQ